MTSFSIILLTVVEEKLQIPSVRVRVRIRIRVRARVTVRDRVRI